jgi:hypothetical protein
MFLTNLPLNRHKSSCMLLGQNGQFDRVAKPGVETSTVVAKGPFRLGAPSGKRKVFSAPTSRDSILNTAH